MTILPFRRSPDQIRSAELIVWARRESVDGETLMETIERLLIRELYLEMGNQKRVADVLNTTNRVICYKMKMYGLPVNKKALA